MIKPEDLIVSSRYQTPGGNTFCLELPFDANRVCFRREYDGHWHYGREFIEYCEGRTMIDLCALSAPGDFKRKGRTVTITLPEFWDQVN